MKEIKMLEQEQMKQDLPDFRPGDTVRVHYKIEEGGKKRIQRFEGTVIKRSGTERIFPLHSPNVSKIVVLRRGKVRRAKLYYLRDRKGKAARIKEKK